MRILFVQLCKSYTFFLVAIATVALGVPIENVIMKRDTNPGCPLNFPIYFSSHCETATSIFAICKNNANPPVYTPQVTPCQPNEHCIEHFANINFDPKNPKNPHATCVNDRNSDRWDNFGNPNADACSVSASYNNRGQSNMMVAMTVYASDWKPIQVNRLEAFENDSGLTPDWNEHNYTAFISDYNDQKIKFCFNTGTNNKVTAYAAVWPVIYQNSLQESDDTLPSDASDSSTPI